MQSGHGQAGHTHTAHAGACCSNAGATVAPAAQRSEQAPGTARDPVCGMSVTIATAKHRHSHAGQDYFFCNPRCLDKFRSNPGQYLAPQPAPAPTPAQPGVIYTCPMHPEIRQDHPGTCPKCGMALDPEMPKIGRAHV